jgi:hypothetical protein
MLACGKRFLPEDMGLARGVPPVRCPLILNHEPEAVPDQCDPGDGDTSRVPGIGNRPTVITMTPREPVSLLNVVIWLRGNSVMDAADLIRAR